MMYISHSSGDKPIIKRSNYIFRDFTNISHDSKQSLRLNELYYDGFHMQRDGLKGPTDLHSFNKFHSSYKFPAKNHCQCE